MWFCIWRWLDQLLVLIPALRQAETIYVRSGLLIGCLVGLLGGFEADAQPSVNRFPSSHSAKPTIIHFEYFVDTTDRLTIGQITDPQLHWQSTPNSSLILGFTPHPVWCRFIVQQSTNVPSGYALELTNFYVDSLTLYQPDRRSGWHIQYSGDLIPLARRTPPTRYPTVFIRVQESTPQTFYARIQSTQHHSYQWRVWDQATFRTDRLPDVDRYITFSLAILLSLFQVALLLFMYQYVVLRSYAIFALAVGLSVLFASGYSSIFFPMSTYWAHTSHYATVGLLLPTLAYYVVQSYQLTKHIPRLVWLYAGFGAVGVVYTVLSFFVRHPYITWALIATLAIMMGFTLVLLIGLYWRGVRPAIWNVLALLITLPVYTYFYGRNAGFFTGSLSEETLRFLMFCCFASEPFFVVLMLWQATRERIRTAERLTHEQAQRETIQALDRLKTDFFTNVSHELRTPLTLLLGPLQMLYKRYPDHELYGLMYRNASRLQTLINQLLDLAKLDAHQMKHSPSLGDLVTDIQTWVAGFSTLAQSRSVQISLRQTQTHWSALYDADKIEKVLSNLISNALKYTPAGGSVTIDVAYLPTEVSIDVTDTGTGMSEKVLSRVFDRFYQGDRVNRLEVGTGIGLSITYELIRLMGGVISVESQPGVGTTFYVSIPVREAKEQLLVNENEPSANLLDLIGYSVNELDLGAEKQSVKKDGLANSFEKPLLLLVEDNDDLRLYLRIILATYYSLVEATDGQQALDMAVELLPDLIVTDLMMPRLDGLELCAALRADPRTDHIPVVMLTAKASVENRLKGLATGADEYLTKPFLPAELLVRLTNLLRRQTAQQAYWQRTLTSGLPQASLHRQETPDFSAPLLADSSPFLERLYTILEQHLDQSEFDVEQLADALAISSRTLNRKLKVILGFNTRETIRSYRLRRANEMLAQGVQPTQAAYAVGFGSLSSFGRAYKDQYGYAPSAHKSK
ncbi:ATP-binding protein [Spirosoma aerolatum]|uniref:ATP-binding protein n=1 Tax=Spirosoma aerolatum TaxID=1211326 RepID=UPI00147623FB|nr:ATP-binding protein [Spirosoma aerolatum]